MIKKDNNYISSVYDETTVIGKIYAGILKVYESWRKLLASGIPPLTLPKCKQANLIDYKVYGESMQAILPSEYQQVEYVESTGTQIINTGVVTSDDVGMYADFYIDAASMIMGSRSDDSSDDRFWINPSSKLYYGWNTSKALDINCLNNRNVVELNLYNSRKVVVINNTVETPITATLNETLSSSNTANIGLFGHINSNGDYRPRNSKIYRAKITKGSTLVRDFIPCYRKSDNEIGMYDLVNDVFYTNINTGVFLKGADAPTPETPIEVESVGDKTNNLFRDDVNTRTYGWLQNGGSISTSANWYITDYIKVYGNEFVLHGLQGGNNPSICVYDVNKTLIKGYAYNAKNTVTISSEQTIYYIRVSYNLTWDLSKLQLEYGTTATEVEPYGYRIPIKVSGKNRIECYGFSAGGGLTPTSSRSLTNSYGTTLSTTNFENSLDITQSKTPDASFPGNYSNGYFAMGLNNAEGEYILSFDIDIKSNPFNVRSMQILNQGGATSVDVQNIQLPSTSKGRVSMNLKYRYRPNSARRYIEFRCMGMSFTISNIMLTKLEQTIDYEPYYEPITTNIYLNEPLRKINDYADYIDFENGKVYRNIKNKAFNGTEYLQLVAGEIAYQVTAGIRDTTAKNIYCTHYPRKARDVLYQNMERENYQGCAYNNTYVRFVDNVNANKSVTAFRTLLKEQYDINNPVTVYFTGYATPKEETIELPNIPLNKGTNIIEIDTTITPSNMEVIYLGKK